MIGVFRERFFTFRMKLKMFITSSDHYLKYLAILFLVKASGLGDFVSQNPLFSYSACPICLCLNIVEYFNVTVVFFKMKLPPKEGRSRELSETVELFQF